MRAHLPVVGTLPSLRKGVAVVLAFALTAAVLYLAVALRPGWAQAYGRQAHAGVTSTLLRLRVLWLPELLMKQPADGVHGARDKATAAALEGAAEDARGQPDAKQGAADEATTAAATETEALPGSEEPRAAVQPLPSCPPVGEGREAPSVPRAAFVYLVHSARLGTLRDSLISLFANFNDRYSYPIVLFHEADLDPAAAQLSLAGALSPPQLCFLRWERVDFSFPPGFDEPAARTEGVAFPHVFPGYHHMCAFWFQHVFAHPLVRNLELYVRMDTDSALYDRIPYDFIRYFHEQNFTYGWRHRATDQPYVTKGLWTLARAFLANTSLPAPPLRLVLPPPDEELTTDVPIYYNNFEVVRVPFFANNPGVADWAQTVAASHGIYWHRWGDAPLRFLTVEMFVEAKRVHHFCDLPYSHPNDQKFDPTCPSPGGNQ